MYNQSFYDQCVIPVTTYELIWGKNMNYNQQPEQRLVTHKHTEADREQLEKRLFNITIRSTVHDSPQKLIYQETNRKENHDKDQRS